MLFSSDTIQWISLRYFSLLLYDLLGLQEKKTCYWPYTEHAQSRHHVAISSVCVKSFHEHHLRIDCHRKCACDACQLYNHAICIQSSCPPSPPISERGLSGFGDVNHEKKEEICLWVMSTGRSTLSYILIFLLISSVFLETGMFSPAEAERLCFRSVIRFSQLGQYKSWKVNKVYRVRFVPIYFCEMLTSSSVKSLPAKLCEWRVQ